MDLNFILAWIFFGGALGLGLAYSLKIPGKAGSIAIAILGALTLTTIRVNWLTLETILNNNPESKAEKTCYIQYEDYKNEVFGYIARTFKASAEEKCDSFTSGRIQLTPEETKQVWALMLSGARRSFYATNIIAPKQWPAASCERQKEARVRRIFRVMIKVAGKDSINTSLDMLADRQLKECSVDKISQYTKSQLYENLGPEIANLGYIDLVLADESTLLMTNYDEHNDVIRHGILTQDRNQIEAARRIFSKLEQLAVPYEITHN